MELEGSFYLAAPPESVWLALNDPEALAQAIPGCEKLEQTEENGFSAIVRLKLGPLDARFSGSVRLSDLDPPHAYTLSGQGQGGVAGFAKGSARVALAREREGTRLSYQAKIELGGKLASLGGRLLSGVAAKLAEEFFFRLYLPTPAAAKTPQPYWLWGGLTIWLFMLWLLFFAK
jgi:carbon monoxide dehydrogenase subunit G